jgi:hypothetical protein
MERVAVILLIGSIGSTGCIFLSSRAWRVTGNSKTKVLLVSDSLEVRRLVTDEDAGEEEVNRFWREDHGAEERHQRLMDMAQHPEQYPPGRSKFLETMARMPGVYVEGRSYCSVIVRSKSRCGRLPIETASYLFVRITSGPSRGQQGWICESKVAGQFP